MFFILQAILGRPGVDVNFIGACCLPYLSAAFPHDFFHFSSVYTIRAVVQSFVLKVAFGYLADLFFSIQVMCLALLQSCVSDLNTACKNTSLVLYFLLLSICSVGRSRAFLDWAAIHIAAYFGHIKVLKLILKVRPKDVFSFVQIRSYPGYPYLGYLKPRLSERSFEHRVCLKKMVFSLISQILRLSRVHVFLCHTYMFNVGAQWYVIVYRVKCKGLQTRPSYIFLCYVVCIQPEKYRLDYQNNFTFQNSL